MLTVVTPVAGRLDHLARVAAGLGRSTLRPYEWIVAWMGGPDPEPILGCVDFPFRSIDVKETPLPLARARNLAAAESRGDLVFLDVDCIPAKDMLAAYRAALCKADGLTCGRTLYLPSGCPTSPEAMLDRGRMHDEQAGLYRGSLSVDREHGMFWSLNFAVRRATFDRVGGFDERFRGYGFEDTDFSYRARELGIPIVRARDALAFHQHHPPTAFRPETVPELIGNARTFRRRWGEWPAPGWFEVLSRRGLVRWDPRGETLEPAETIGSP